MGRGKIAVQCSHAAVSAAEDARIRHPVWWRGWLREGQCKVALRVRTVEALSGLGKEADTRGLPYSIVQDSGLTQVAPGTITCLGIGPAPANLLDPLTGRLPLL